MTNSIFSSLPRKTDLMEDREGSRLAAYLDLNQSDLPQDISERLRAARHHAVTQRKPTRISQLTPATAGAALTWQGDERLGAWARIGSVLPLLALIAGLVLITSFQNEHRARELAEVDLALLLDELPVAAFADPGFLQFLKAEP